jgi:hypothetical protein
LPWRKTPFDTENKDVLLAAELAMGKSAATSASDMGLSKSTVMRRLRDPAFRTLVAEIRSEMLSEALGRMVDKITGGVDKVGALLENEEPAIQLRAFRALMTFGLRLRETVDLDEHIRQLREELARRKEVEP